MFLQKNLVKGFRFIDTDSGRSPYFQAGHSDLTLQHQQASIIECTELRDTKDVLTADGFVGTIEILLAWQKVIAKSLNAKQRVALQDMFGSDVKQMAMGIIGQRFDAIVMVSLFESLWHFQASSCPLTVQLIFIHLIILFTCYKYRIR